MSDLLHDQVWQFVGAVLALLAVFISIVIYFKERRRKQVSYVILSIDPLLGWGAAAFKGELQLTYDGKLVDSPYLVSIRIFNSGNVPIPSSDYERPISVGFGSSARILKAEVVETVPKNLNATISLAKEPTGERLVLSPSLLNSGDSIDLRMLIAEYNQVCVDGRLVGVKEIKITTEKDDLSPIFVMVLGGIFVWIGIIGSIVMSVGHSWWPFVVAFLVVGFVVMSISIPLSLRPIFKKRK
jgi:hypothetical protein